MTSPIVQCSAAPHIGIRNHHQVHVRVREIESSRERAKAENVRVGPLISNPAAQVLYQFCPDGLFEIPGPNIFIKITYLFMKPASLVSKRSVRARTRVRN